MLSLTKEYGNYASYCMLACGNEPSGRWFACSVVVYYFIVYHPYPVAVVRYAVPNASANSQKHTTPAHKSARFLRSIPLPSLREVFWQQ